MSRGFADDHVQLLDDTGAAVESPFLALAELWNPAATHLTLLIDPGRIKRGLVPHEHLGPVLEAILPKSKYPERLLAYTNLTLACSVCNNNKGDYDEPSLPLLNPYEDNPDDELIALGPLIRQRPGRRRGEVTVLTLELNRAELVEMRQDRMERVARLADEFAVEPDGPLKTALAKELEKEREKAAAYSFVVGGFLDAARILASK